MKKLKKRIHMDSGSTVQRYDIDRCETISNYQCRTECSPIYETAAYNSTRASYYRRVVDL